MKKRLKVARYIIRLISYSLKKMLLNSMFVRVLRLPVFLKSLVFFRVFEIFFFNPRFF